MNLFSKTKSIFISLIAIAVLTSVSLLPQPAAVHASSICSGSPSYVYFKTTNKWYGNGRFCLKSSNQVYVAIYQSDGNFVVYHGSQPIWNSLTNGKGATKIVLQGDGNIVIYNNATPYSSVKALWASNTGRYPGLNVDFRLTMQNGGNLVLTAQFSGSTYIPYVQWSTNTAGK